MCRKTDGVLVDVRGGTCIRSTTSAPIGANGHEPDLRRSIDFHAVLLAMAGHDLRQHLQIILNSYGWLSARATSYPERERIARGQNAVMQMAEQLHQLVTALRIHQKTSGMTLVPVRLGSLFSTLGQDATRFAAERGVRLRVVPTRAVVASDPVLLAILRAMPWNLPLQAARFFLDVAVLGRWFASRFMTDIFEAFHRLEPTRSDGLGLGLFVVNRAAELLQHQIEVRSTVGRGSCFTVLVNASGPV
jgi:two-component system phosphate regulon sensor histidine kinase PhoR